MEKKILALKESLDVIRHYNSTFAALADERVLRLLGCVDSESFTNYEIRTLLGLSKKKVWSVLTHLVSIGIIERRRYSYTITPSTYDLANMLASSLRALLSGRPLQDSLSATLLKLGPEFVEWAYTKGKIDRAELARCEKELKDLRAESAGLV